MHYGFTWCVIGAVAAASIQTWHPHLRHIDQHTVTLHSNNTTTIVVGSVSSAPGPMTWAS